MNPIYQVLGAAGQGPWIPVNRGQSPFEIGLAVMLSAGAVLTCSVQHTFDTPSQEARPVSITRSTTTATVLEPAHSLRTGDSIMVYNTGNPGMDGQFTVTSTTSTTYTYTVPNTGSTVANQHTTLKSFRVFNHATINGASADADGNYDFPVGCLRLIVSAWTSGTATLAMFQGMGRS